jgi:iron(III) transport system substrate-binding protein
MDKAMHQPHKITNMKKILSYLCAFVASLFLLACEKHSETLVLYTSQIHKDLAVLLEAFHKAHPNIKIEVFRSGTTEVLDRLAVEIKNNDIHPDIVMISDAVAMESLSQKDVLRFLDIDFSNLPSAFYNKDKTYCGTKKISIGIVYNKDVTPAPQSFADLTKPEFKNKVVMPSPMYSGAAALMLGVLLENPVIGWDFYKNLKSNDITMVKGNGDVIEVVEKGEKSIGIVVDFMAFNAKNKGSPVEFIYPKEGIITLTEPIGLIKKKGASKENLESAKKFVQFVLGREGQIIAKKQGYKSIRESDRVDGKTIFINTEKLLADIDANKKGFVELFGH